MTRTVRWKWLTLYAVFQCSVRNDDSQYRFQQTKVEIDLQLKKAPFVEGLEEEEFSALLAVCDHPNSHSPFLLDLGAVVSWESQGAFYHSDYSNSFSLDLEEVEFWVLMGVCDCRVQSCCFWLDWEGAESLEVLAGLVASSFLRRRLLHL